MVLFVGSYGRIRQKEVSINISKKVLFILAGGLFVFLLVFLIYRINLLSKTTDGEKISSYLICKKKDLENYVLSKDTEYKNANYESRVMFINNKIYNVSFTISQRFSSENLAAVFTDKMNANYNIYIGKNKIITKNLVSSYSSIDNTGKMVIFVKPGGFDEKVAPLVMLDADVLKGENELGNVQYDYEKQGFSCSINTQDMVLSD